MSAMLRSRGVQVNTHMLLHGNAQMLGVACALIGSNGIVDDAAHLGPDFAETDVRA